MKAHTLLRRCAAEQIDIASIAQAIKAYANDLPEGIRKVVAEELGYHQNTTYHAAFDAAVAYNEISQSGN
jgi:hypothetical protein